jgi:glycosyltransferase involved in cell wall biosynthesis
LTPLFSVLIPTKDRPEFVGDAVASVLLQDGSDRDFEVVVSNNGGGEATKRAVAAWGQDDRFVYVEPPSELSMPDHWEWASQFLKGEYVLILTDRLMLRQGALESLRKLIGAESRPQVISWPIATYSNVSGATANTGTEPGRIEEHSSRAIWEGLRRGQYLPSPILPRGLNSCVHRSVYDKVRAMRGRVFDSISPDFSSAFSVVFVSDLIHHYNRPLAIEQGIRVSNGALMRRGVDTGFMKPLGSRGQMQHVPLYDVGNPLVTTVIYEDFFRTAAAFGSEASWKEINPVAFYRDCFSEVVARHVGAVPWSGHLRTLRRRFAEAIKNEGLERSRQVRRELRGTFPWRQMVSLGLNSWGQRHLVTFLRNTRLRWSRVARYSSALDAAGFGNGSQFRAGPTPQPLHSAAKTRGGATPTDRTAPTFR